VFATVPGLMKTLPANVVATDPAVAEKPVK